jgi:cell division protein FtsW
VRKIRLKKQTKKADKTLLILVFILTGLGLIVVADASAPIALHSFSDKYYFVKQQAVWGLIGITGLFFISRLKYTFWEKIANPLFLGTFILLILVLIPEFSSKLLGARRWLTLGPISFQPGEFIKLSLAVYFSKIASKDKKLLAYLIPIIAVCALVMLQPDLGTTIIILAIGLVQLFISGINLFYLGGLTMLTGLIGFILIITSPYRKDRLITFLEQTADPLGKGYHIRQILYALGAGGFFGVGLGQSRQKYLFLPESATDSIFAIIAEEAGFLGATFIIILFAIFIYRGIVIAKGAPDKFSRVLAAGLTAWIGGQAFLNIASMVALVPLTGIPLPFFSYGGSSLTTVLFACGILLNISRYESKEK